MTENLAEKIKSLAEFYETSEFLKNDPSRFMHEYSGEKNQEAAAFIAANLAFGRRDQILSHAGMIFEDAGSDLLKWILEEKYKSFFEDSAKSFYRMYSGHDMILFFDGLKEVFKDGLSAGEFFRNKWQKAFKDTERLSPEKGLYLHQVISAHFCRDCRLLPHSAGSAAKKVNMMLRWLVRDNSPVDLGLWNWYGKEKLLMPLDTHVMQQANELGLIETKSACLRTAVLLTKKMGQIFPDDPVKADFALFGYGVEAGQPFTAF